MKIQYDSHSRASGNLQKKLKIQTGSVYQTVYKIACLFASQKQLLKGNYILVSQNKALKLYRERV
ncbi:MAG: hypothetical protein OXJ52_04970 [Oligoflexia bacterium]|nr:hypothetical protein [Oligoflexia bacterium]